jgi:ADP-heptose:LPS heptosyltransferase
MNMIVRELVNPKNISELSIIRRIPLALLGMLVRNPAPKSKIPIQELRSLLVIGYGDGIGDLVLATALYRAVKRRNPNCRIGLITSERNGSIVAADPDVDDRYLFVGRSDFGHFSELARARAVHYQVLLNVHFRHMSDFAMFAQYIAPDGIKATGLHKAQSFYKLFFNYISNRNRRTTHIAHHALEILNEVIDFQPPLTMKELRPTLHVPDTYVSDVRRKIDERLRGTGAKWFIVLNTQARDRSLEWGLENAIAFAKVFTENHPDGAIMLTGMPETHGGIQAAVEDAGLTRVDRFHTSKDLLELAALIGESRLVISPDTASVHIGVAANKPIISFLPDKSSDHIEWLPIQVPSRIFVAREGADVSSIKVDDVLCATEELLDGSWSQTQTSFDPTAEVNPLFQATSGESLLSCFEEKALTSL